MTIKTEVILTGSPVLWLLKMTGFIVLLTNCCLMTGLGYPYADRSFYLIDSLKPEELTARDKYLLDSALHLYHQAGHDTGKVKALGIICEQLTHASWERYQHFQYRMIQQVLAGNIPDSEREFHINFLAGALNNIGYIHMNTGDNTKALESYGSSMKYYHILSNSSNPSIVHQGKFGQGVTLNNMALVYDAQGNIKKALAAHHQSIKLREETGDVGGVANSLNNMAVLYTKQGDWEKAFEYYHRAMEIWDGLEDRKGVALSLNNIGKYYEHKGDDNKALQNYQQSLHILEDVKNKKGLAYTLNHIGRIYGNKAKRLQRMKANNDSSKAYFDLALSNFQRSLRLKEAINDKSGISHSLNSISDLKLAFGDIAGAAQYAEKSLALAQKIAFPENISISSRILSKVAHNRKDWKTALVMYELHIQMRDSIQNTENQKAAIRQQMSYDFEKKEALLEAEQEKQKLVHREKIKRQELIIWAVGAGLFLVVIFSIFLYNRFKITQLQKNVIADQKQVVDEKNKHITDSINYAKKIQEAILPSATDLNHAFALPGYFVLFMPKDIVSGDFYWVNRIEGDIVAWAAVDCTGHGVPGAFMSMIGNSLLNEIVIEKKILQPDLILNELRRSIKKALGYSGEAAARKDGLPTETTLKDGMDIALCTWNKSTNKLQFSGAYNPLYIIRKNTPSPTSSNPDQKADSSAETSIKRSQHNDHMLLEVKADRQPVGSYMVEKPFTLQEIDLQPGDTIYTFSDGYLDQFGEGRGILSEQPTVKKFTARRFRELLLSFQDQPLHQQKEILQKTIEAWMEGHEQLDDICVIGIKV